MFRKHSQTLLKLISNRRNVHLSSKRQDHENPFTRTWRILKDDFKTIRQVDAHDPERQRALMGLFPRHADVVIIGGGAMGSSTAYWLKEKTSREGLNVVVIEKDPTYSKCSTTLSVGGLRQQFSLSENIHMSLFGAEFIRKIKQRFGPHADVCFTPHGYLVLASEQGAQQLIDNYRLQRELGSVSEILSKERLKERFPWMNVEDVELGCLGLEKEGWFDPWALLCLMKFAATDMGTQYIQGEVVDFLFEANYDLRGVDGSDDTFERVQEVVVKLPDGEHKTIKFSKCVIAAGPESGELARLARIGAGNGILSVPLPVEKRKRYVYTFDCQGEPPGINTPMVIDYSGAYFRREGLGGQFIAGMSPLPEEEPHCKDLEVDHQFFDERVWPIIAKRVPAFNSIKVRNAWSGFYEYNVFDENGIIGTHPYHTNLYFATGFSGHGIQQAPAAGRAIAELMLDGYFMTLDLTRLGFDRLIVDKPVFEIGIY